MHIMTTAATILFCAGSVACQKPASAPARSAASATESGPVRDDLARRADALIADLQVKEAEGQRLSQEGAPRVSGVPTKGASVVILPERARSSSVSSARSPAAAPEPSPGTTTTMVGQAEAAFAPTLMSLSRRADTQDSNFRRYLDACYEKVTKATTAGNSFGVGSESSTGAVVGQRGFIAWDVDSRYRWQESWVAGSEIDNATTAYCRSLWSDIAADAAVIRSELANIDEAARRAGIYPGVIRELRAQYGFAR